ncbi:BppU family phage baseplate upper protein [Tetragenococcus halophilus]|nr:BppU family phage baseplate upper protein [Tetragenococcus halophilus]
MLRKIAEIKVPKGAGPREAKTNPIFATYDRQGAAFAFFFSDSNIAGAAANLLFMVDGKKVFVDDGVTLGETNETHTFTYPLPDKLLNYTGKVDGYLYFDFEDGSHSDEIHFVFTIKKSQIDEEMEDAPDVYIKSFEEIKADVQSTADKATSDIKSRVDAVENAKNSTVGDIEKARDNAESQIGDYVGEVESAKDSTIEDIDKALPEVEDKLDEVAGKISELDISDTNLLKGTSDEWEIYEWNKHYGFQGAGYSLGELGLKFGDTITLSKALDNTLDDNDLQIWVQINFEDINGKTVSKMTTSSIESGQKGYVKGTTKIPEKTDNLYIFKANKGNNQVAKVAAGKESKLQLGTLATSWTPAPEDIVTKSELEKIKQAIINLGGSI